MGEIIAVIIDIFKFWDQVVFVIDLLRKTPSEKHEEIMQKVKSAFDENKNAGRPKWG